MAFTGPLAASACHLNSTPPGDFDFFSQQAGFVTADQKEATHLNTRWRNPRWPWPRVSPGRRGDMSGSHPPPYDAGRRRPASRVPPQSTRWRDRYTYIWGERQTAGYVKDTTFFPKHTHTHTHGECRGQRRGGKWEGVSTVRSCHFLLSSIRQNAAWDEVCFSCPFSNCALSLNAPKSAKNHCTKHLQDDQFVHYEPLLTVYLFAIFNV